MEPQTLVREFGAALYGGHGVLFVGSGVSVQSGAASWADLLAPVCRALGIELTRDDDLPQIAQYYVNYHVGNRGPLINMIRQCYSARLHPNELHQVLGRINVGTIWTTNYDTLIEDTFRVLTDIDVKVGDGVISRPIATGKCVEIIKMHGCVRTSPPEDIVITQEDYDDYLVTHPATAERLRYDVQNRSLLFVGYGYRDPNIRNIVLEARRLQRKATRCHYLVQTKVSHSDKAQEKDLIARQKLWCENLRRVGIETTLVDTRHDLRLILEGVSRQSKGPAVFITGSHRESALPLAQEVGASLALSTHYVLLDGQSEGIGRLAASAFSEAAIARKMDISERIRLFPNPYAANPSFANDASLLPLLKKWRARLLNSAHAVIAFDGGIGTEAEVDLALDLGCTVIPAPTSPSPFMRELLSNGRLVERLEGLCPEYLQKVASFRVSCNDILSCLREVLA